jgi:hypothetical protein
VLAATKPTASADNAIASFIFASVDYSPFKRRETSQVRDLIASGQAVLARICPCQHQMEALLVRIRLARAAMVPVASLSNIRRDKSQSWSASR